MVQGGAGIQGVSLGLSKAIVGQFTVTLSTYIFGKDVPAQPIDPDVPLGWSPCNISLLALTVSALQILFMIFFWLLRQVL